MEDNITWSDATLSLH